MFRRWLLTALMIGGAAFAPAAQAGSGDEGETPVDYTSYKLVHVNVPTAEDLDRVLEISERFTACRLHLGDLPFVLSPQELERVRATGLEIELLHDNVQELIDAEREAMSVRDDAWFAAYKSTAQVNARMDELVALRPDLASKYVVGTSVQGRTIYGLQITGPGDATGRAGLLFNGCQHAREWVAVMVPMYLADRMIEQYDNDPQIAALLNEAVVYIIPIVNPDGYEYSRTTDRYWRKNRRNNGNGTYGVDLNRNWGFAWGGEGSSGSTSSEIYRGPAPFSEPETQALRDFMIARPEIVAHIDFHSYSQLILYPYSYNYVLPGEPDRTRFINLSADMADAIFAVSGKVYTDQPSYALYLAAGVSTDWAYGDRGIFSWTIELRPASSFPGFELPQAEILPTSLENWAAVMTMSQQMAVKLAIGFPAGQPAQIQADEPYALTVSIEPLNAALEPGSAKCHTRSGDGPFTATSLAPIGGNLYEATLPATPCGETVEYYIEAQTTTGEFVFSPSDAPTTVFAADAMEITIAFEDDMEIDRGWTVGAPDDDATTGIWNRMDPEGTAAQPEDDHTPDPGVMCWVTDGRAGSSIGTYDVDNGKTTLTSPIMDAAGLDDPYVSYWRWYSNDAGAAPNTDVFEVFISNNGGASWVPLEVVGPSGPGTSGGWIYAEFRVLDFVAPTGQLRLRFVASDYDPGSIVEAAIDDLLLLNVGCSAPEPCPGDLDGDGDRGLGDLSILLSNFGTTSGATYADGDIDGDGDVDLADLSVLLESFGQPCP